MMYTNNIYKEHIKNQRNTISDINNEAQMRTDLITMNRDMTIQFKEHHRAPVY